MSLHGCRCALLRRTSRSYADPSVRLRAAPCVFAVPMRYGGAESSLRTPTGPHAPAHLLRRCPYPPPHHLCHRLNARGQRAASRAQPAGAVSSGPRRRPHTRRGARSRGAGAGRWAAGGRADVTGGVGAAPPLPAARLPPRCQGDGYTVRPCAGAQPAAPPP